MFEISEEVMPRERISKSKSVKVREELEGVRVSAGVVFRPILASIESLESWWASRFFSFSPGTFRSVAHLLY